MIYTSGTTGRPKGVRRLPLNQGDPDTIALAAQTLRTLGLMPGMRTVVTGPLYHTAPNAYSLTASRLGAFIVLQPRFDPEQLLQIVEVRQAWFLGAALGARLIRRAFARCHLALLVFHRGHRDFHQAARFLVGLAPSMLQMGYLVDPSRVDLAARTGPSTPMACDLCAGIAATEALKVLLGRGGVVAAPRGVHFDAYKNRLRRTWRPGGNAHPLQRALLAVTRRRYASGLAGADAPKGE